MKLSTGGFVLWSDSGSNQEFASTITEITLEDLHYVTGLDKFINVKQIILTNIDLVDTGIKWEKLTKLDDLRLIDTSFEGDLSGLDYDCDVYMKNSNRSMLYDIAQFNHPDFDKSAILKIFGVKLVMGNKIVNQKQLSLEFDI